MSVSETSSPADEFTPFDLEEAQAQLAQQRLQDLIKFRASDTGKELAGWVRQEHKRCKDNRVQEERQWALNLARYKGRSDLMIIPNDPRLPQQLWGRIGRKPEHSKNKRVVNRVRPLVRTEIARLVSQKPSAYVVPATSEDQDLFAAQAGEQAWQSIADRRKIQNQFLKAAFWITITGNGFIKTWWDPGSFDQDSALVGDIMFGAPSPFHIFVPDKMEQEIEDQPYVIHAYAKPIEWVRHHYAEQLAGEELKADASIGSAIMENSVMGVADNETTQKDAVVIYEMWAKPGAHRLLPEGGLITLAGSVMVGYQPGLPYAHGEFPFAKFDHLPTETFYADSVINDIDSLSDEYNQVRSRILQSIDRMSSLQLIAPVGAVDPKKITNETGQVIQYKPGFGKPEPFPVQNLPGYVTQHLDRVLLDIEDISGQHQVSKGNVPTGVTAATAISYLQERDDSYLTHTYRSVETGFEKIARQALNLAVQYWDQPRLVKTVGEDSAFDIRQLQGADLKSGVDIRIEAGSALPQSKSARQALVMDLMAQGFIPPQEGLKIMEIGGAQKIIDQLRVDERQAQRENLKMRQLTEEEIQFFNGEYVRAAQEIVVQQGAPEIPDIQAPPIVPVNPWDNHEVHIQVHNNFRKSQAFELLSPAVKDQFDQHVTAHEEAIVATSIEQFMREIPGDGTDAGAAIGEMAPPTDGAAPENTPEGQMPSGSLPTGGSDALSGPNATEPGAAQGGFPPSG